MEPTLTGSGAQAGTAPGSAVIETGRRFSHSMLWQLQRKFYEQRGVEAWKKGFVPHYVTNNPTIAAAYARVACAFLQDAMAAGKLDARQPVYLLELGAGSGRLAYHILRQLPAALERSGLKGQRVVYVLADMAERNLEFWRSHPRLQPFFASGQLDLARYDPLTEREIRLERSGATLAAGAVTNPLVVLANYFFCVIPVDIFSVQRGILFEELVELASTDLRLVRDDPALLPGLAVELKPSFAAAPYYDDPEIDRLLHDYPAIMGDEYLTFPIAGLTCLRNLNMLAGGPLLALTGDRGYASLDALREQGRPEFSLHGNSLSMMVNFHALGEWVRRRGGERLFTQHRAEGLLAAAFEWGLPAGGDGQVRLAFAQELADGGPDDFFQVKRALEPHYAELSLEQILALLRLSGYDHNIFSGCSPRLLDLAGGCSPTDQERLCEVLDRAWEMYYAIGEPFNLPLAAARIYLAVGHGDKALVCLREAERLYGPSAETSELIRRCGERAWASDFDPEGEHPSAENGRA
ncbi:MAG TPA: SAM-dependent methyltransferase [Anaerolineaceae bacterium]